jgi:hypothetical protein
VRALGLAIAGIQYAQRKDSHARRLPTQDRALLPELVRIDIDRNVNLSLTLSCVGLPARLFLTEAQSHGPTLHPYSPIHHEVLFNRLSCLYEMDF